MPLCVKMYEQLYEERIVFVYITLIKSNWTGRKPKFPKKNNQFIECKILYYVLVQKNILQRYVKKKYTLYNFIIDEKLYKSVDYSNSIQVLNILNTKQVYYQVLDTVTILFCGEIFW